MFVFLSVLILSLLFGLVSIYNQIIFKKNFVKNSFSQIDNQLQRRYDLIPNLVESVKGITKHEKETLESVTLARNQCVGMLKLARQSGSATDFKNLFETEGLLTQSLSKLFMVNESYPELKADVNFRMLMEELSSTENKVSFARQAYNDGVMDFNSYISKFPHLIVAAGFKFKEYEFFKIENQEIRETPKVKFG
jgi:LemA protein